LVLGFEELNLSPEFVLGTSSQEEQEWLEKPSHGDRILGESQVVEGGKLFTRADWKWFDGKRVGIPSG
jgi:hypothetical protein